MTATLARLMVELLLLSPCGLVLFFGNSSFVDQMKQVELGASGAGPRFNISQEVTFIEFGNNKPTVEVLNSCAKISIIDTTTSQKEAEELLDIDEQLGGRIHNHVIFKLDPTESHDCKQLGAAVTTRYYETMEWRSRHSVLICRERSTDNEMGSYRAMINWPGGSRLSDSHSLLISERRRYCDLGDPANLRPFSDERLIEKNASNFIELLTEECVIFTTQDYKDTLDSFNERQVGGVRLMDCSRLDPGQRTLLQCKKEGLLARKPTDYVGPVLAALSVLALLTHLAYRILLDKKASPETRDCAIDSALSTMILALEQLWLLEWNPLNRDSQTMLVGTEFLRQLLIAAVILIPLANLLGPLRGKRARIIVYSAAVSVGLINITAPSLGFEGFAAGVRNSGLIAEISLQVLFASPALSVVLWRHREKLRQVGDVSRAAEALQRSLGSRLLLTWLVDVPLNLLFRQLFSPQSPPWKLARRNFMVLLVLVFWPLIAGMLKSQLSRRSPQSGHGDQELRVSSNAS